MVNSLQIALFQGLSQLMHNKGVRGLRTVRRACDGDATVVDGSFHKVAPGDTHTTQTHAHNERVGSVSNDEVGEQR